jgi:hypothetical protein
MIVLVVLLGGGNGIVGIALSVFVAVAWVMCMGGICCGCRVREVLGARGREEDRGGTVLAGMLYMLDMLLLSAGLDGDGDLEVRPLWRDLMPLLSMLVFLSGSTFSPCRLSLLGRRLVATEGFRDISVREVLRGKLFVRTFRGKVSAKLDSVTSRMSDKGRGFAQQEAMECPL